MIPIQRTDPSVLFLFGKISYSCMDSSPARKMLIFAESWTLPSPCDILIFIAKNRNEPLLSISDSPGAALVGLWCKTVCSPGFSALL